MLAWMLKTRRIKGRLILVDAGGAMQRFNRMFAETLQDQIVHLTPRAGEIHRPLQENTDHRLRRTPLSMTRS